MRPLIVAHRGDTSRSRENTLAAFESAILAGADMVELDVHRLADGTLIVHHDSTVAGHALDSISYAEFHQHVGAGLNAPRLAQVLELCAGRIRLDIELKSSCVDEVLSELARAGLPVDQYILTSFRTEILDFIRRATHSVQTGLITEHADFETALRDFRGVGADFWLPDGRNVEEGMPSRCAALQMRLLPWNVNSDDDIERFTGMPGVVGIITDRTSRALELRTLKFQ